MDSHATFFFPHTGNAFLVFLSFLILFSCNPPIQAEEEAIYIVSDFTEEEGFTPGIEGPAVDKDGNIYAVNFAEQGTIGIVSPSGEADMFVRLPEGSIGNGIRIDASGNMYIADYTKHNVLKVDMTNKVISVHAHDTMMNQPNDLAIKKDGTLFASDPNWAASTGQLWRIDTDGSTHLLEGPMGTTNGVEVSPDETRLYVGESIQRNVWVYDLSPSGEVRNKRLFTKFPDFGMDGIRCDVEGNVYITRYDKGTVAIFSPSGELLEEVQLKGKKPTNIAFGGTDGKTCYVTLADRGCFETFRAKFSGRAFEMY